MEGFSQLFLRTLTGEEAKVLTDPAHQEDIMLRLLAIFLLFASAASNSSPWFDGAPNYADDASRRLAAELLEAHGGMQPIRMAQSLQFKFFTKIIGGPDPFYSIESIDLSTGSAHLEWPFWNSTVAWHDGEVWSHRWPMPMPAGFFVRLTSSFMTLPWQMQADSANVGPVTNGQLPNDETIYEVLRITFDERSPSIPGTFYEVYVDPETHLMKGIRFDINHPGMVANPKQPLGPNFHVFIEYRQFESLTLPTSYMSYGTGSANGGSSNAYHFAWDVKLDEPFDQTKLVAPDEAVMDAVSMGWWQTAEHESQVGLTGDEE
jgi:hypothetical protein